MSHPVVVGGMHASGTSMVASLLSAAGVDLGDDFRAPDSHNPIGYFEDGHLTSLDRRILEAASGDPGRLAHPDWGWNEGRPLDRSVISGFRPEAQAVVARFVARGDVWGLEDPRVTVLADLWDDVLPEARWVFVYHYPWDVVDSLQRMGSDEFLEHPEVGWGAWLQYNQAVLEFSGRHPDRCLVVAAGRVVREPAVLLRLVADLGVDLDVDAQTPARPDMLAERAGPSAMSTVLRATHPEVVATLEALGGLDAMRGGEMWSSAPLRFVRPPRDPVLAVVIPAHSERDHLVEAVVSVEDTAPDATEVVIVDDGSTDERTVQMLAGLRSLGYEVISRPNGGVGAARNTGIGATTAPIVACLDGDDRYSRDFLPAAVAAFGDDPGLGVVYGPFREFGLRTGRPHIPAFDTGEMLRRNPVQSCAPFRREVVDDVGGYAEGQQGWEDWDLWLGAIEHDWGFARLDLDMFDYRVRPRSSATRSHDPVHRRLLFSRLVGRHRALYEAHVLDLVLAADRAIEDLRAECDALIALHGDAVAALGGEVARCSQVLESVNRRRGLVVEQRRHLVRHGAEVADRLDEVRARREWVQGSTWWWARALVGRAARRIIPG